MILYFYVKMLYCKFKHKADLLPSPLASCVNCWRGSWERCSTRPLGWCLYHPPWILICVSYFCVRQKGEREEKMNDGAKHCLAEPSDTHALPNCLDVPYMPLGPAFPRHLTTMSRLHSPFVLALQCV